MRYGSRAVSALRDRAALHGVPAALRLLRARRRVALPRYADRDPVQRERRLRRGPLQLELYRTLRLSQKRNYFVAVELHGLVRPQHVVARTDAALLRRRQRRARRIEQR